MKCEYERHIFECGRYNNIITLVNKFGIEVKIITHIEKREHETLRDIRENV